MLAIRALRMGWAVPVVFALGCSSSESGGETMTCGAGTHPEGNKCVPDAVDGGGGSSGAAGGGGSGSGGEAGLGGSAGSAGGSSGGTAGDAGSGGTAVDPAGDCPKGLPGPSLVEITAPNGVKYCIDSTEVTWGQYGDFFDQMQYNTGSQPSFCSWNDTFSTESMVDNPDDHPVTDVNWCQALAYCGWAGKRLCGRVGGGPIGFEGPDEPRDANVQEWYGACSNGGTTTYTYGDTYDPEACRVEYDSQADEFGSAPVGSYPDCHGVDLPHSAVFDLTGNVMEWTAECEVGPGDSISCLVIGGSYAYGSYPHPLIDCSLSGANDSRDAFAQLGFRCCADPET